MICIHAEQDALESYLADDAVSDNQFVYPTYTCINYSNDLITNLRDEGWDAHKLIVRTPHRKGHIMVYVKGMWGGGYIIEPETDEVWRVGDPVIDDYFFSVLGYQPEIVRVLE